jgi:TRAP-type C4-dicarboxylate transport system permease large subunit
VLFFIAGMFIDPNSIMLIFLPTLFPLASALGIDPVHFGMVMILNLGIGLITPPVGPTLFVGCAIGKVTMEQVSKELWPFYAAMCLALLLVTYIPALSLWLPGLLK